MRRVVTDSRSAESSPVSSRALGPARMARPSAWTRASSSDSIRASDSVRRVARTFVSNSRSVAARSSSPARSRAEAADSSSASSSGEIATSRRSASDRRRQRRLGSSEFREVEGPERRRDRVAHALGGPPADSEVVLNVVQRESAERPLEAHRESHELRYLLVPHRADLLFTCFDMPE